MDFAQCYSFGFFVIDHFFYGLFALASSGKLADPSAGLLFGDIDHVFSGMAKAAGT